MMNINKENIPFVYTAENFNLLSEIPKLADGQVYIYVMQNSSGNIKIGKTTNIKQRVRSLSGSNCGGAAIERVYCSPATFLESIESTCHNHFHYARISGEWFDSNKIGFLDVVKYVESLFHTKNYENCNALRRNKKCHFS